MSDLKDPFEILADEITLLRKELGELKRTSLDKDEAEAVHRVIVAGVNKMSKTGEAVQQALTQDIAKTFERLQEATQKAAEKAVSEALVNPMRNPQSYSRAAGEARKVAWQSFGGLWAWMAAAGAVLAVIATVAVQGRR